MPRRTSRYAPQDTDLARDLRNLVLNEISQARALSVFCVYRRDGKLVTGPTYRDRQVEDGLHLSEVKEHEGNPAFVGTITTTEVVQETDTERHLFVGANDEVHRISVHRKPPPPKAKWLPLTRRSMTVYNNIWRRE